MAADPFGFFKVDSIVVDAPGSGYTEGPTVSIGATYSLSSWDQWGIQCSRCHTDYESTKAKELEENSFASLLFLWLELERQVRITGKAERVSREESEKYFISRPRESQLGAWASKQSSVISNRKILEDQFEEMKKRFENQEIDLPPFWGGYKVIPQKIEFWQGRENRLHDRISYLLDKGTWKIERLSP